MHKSTRAIAVALAALTFGDVTAAQQRVFESSAGDLDTLVRVIPGPRYDASPFAQKLLGSGWRDLWTTPIDVPLLSPSHYAGGLKVDRRGGGYQSITLHLSEERGWREYRFRSVNKHPMQAMPPAIAGTLAGAILQDQVSSLFPAAPLLVPPFLEAIGVLHVVPRVYRMRDDARLGDHRDAFAGLLGTMELKGTEAPDEQPGFGGSRKIKGTKGFLDDLEKSRAHRLDEHEFFAARLVDFLINDTDRTPANVDWARFGDSAGYRWRPIPRDRDRAFMNARGWLNTLVIRPVYPKLIPFGPEYLLTGLTYTSHTLDRRLLQRLSRADVETVAARVHRAITDEVIEQAIAEMPDNWRTRDAEIRTMRTALRARRDALPRVALQFYRELATDVDIRGTRESDRAVIERHDDGRVTVVISDSFYRRTFLPGETKEVRLYLGGGADTAVVRGAASETIVVRIMGEAGDDVLVDSAGGSATHLYDSEGANSLGGVAGVRVNTKAWTPPTPATGMRLGSPWSPDWGGTNGPGWSPVVKHRTGAGVIVGAGPGWKSYGFRRLPHHWAAGAKVLVGTANRRLALAGEADYRLENSPLAFVLDARASQLEGFRFHGYGNATAPVSRHLSLVEQTTLAVEPAMVWHIGWRAREGFGNAIRGEAGEVPGRRPVAGALRVGPVVSWTKPEPAGGSPLSLTETAGQSAFGMAGVRAALELDGTDKNTLAESGWKLDVDAGAFPAAWQRADAFAVTRAEAAAYLPLMSGGPRLAFRIGGSSAAGDTPVQFAPALGGWRTLRGFVSGRYSGDASAYGAAELRAPVGTVNLFLRFDTGVFGFADFGRVWFDGRSDGSWHRGGGGGIWLSALGRTVSLAYARGEESRFYLKTGLF